jgi:hypothetical protein
LAHRKNVKQSRQRRISLWLITKNPRQVGESGANVKKSLFLTVLPVLLAVLFVSTAAAWEPGDTLWTRTYGGTQTDEAYCVDQTTDDGYIVAGQTRSFGAGEADFYLVKTNSLGNMVWSRTYGGSDSSYAQSVQQTTDGGYILAGGTYSFGAGEADFYIVKTDPLGDTLWTRTKGGSNHDWAHSVQQTTDGGYIVAGATNSFGAGGYDFYLVKTNSVGATLWSRTYGGRGDDYGRFVQQTADGGYIVAGYSDSFGAGGYDFYLVKTDSLGNILWTGTYGGSVDEEGRSVQQTTDGGYIVAGCTRSFGAGLYDFYLVKTDPLGILEWDRTYGGDSNDRALSVRQTTDGGYIVTGATASFGAGNQDVYLVKTDPDGDSLWTRTYGGSRRDRGSSVVQTADGGYIVAGLTQSFGAGGTDMYLVRIAPPPPTVTLTIVPGDTVVAHYEALCYHLICENHTPDYLQLSFEVEVRLPGGQMYGPIFGPARFGMFGNGVSEGDMYHVVPRQAPLGHYWLYAEVYNTQYSAIDSMAFTVTGNGELVDVSLPLGEWETLLARIGDWDFLGTAAETGLPTQFALSHNHPNPFNASTAIEYQLPEASEVKLEVYNLIGEKVATLVDSKQEAGYRSVVWEASEVSSGLYFYRLTAGDFTETKRMMLVK